MLSIEEKLLIKGLRMLDEEDMASFKEEVAQYFIGIGVMGEEDGEYFWNGGGQEYDNYDNKLIKK